MTQSELNQLDEEVKNGTLSEDEYIERLRSEVSLLHRELSDEDIRNMFQMQLRIMAIDDVLKEDNTAACVLTDVLTNSDRRVDDPFEELKKQIEKEKAKQEKQQKKCQQKKQKEHDEKPKQDKADNQDRKQHDKSSDSKQNDQKDKKKDKQKDKSKSGGGSNKWWWTYQIVPDWNEWMKDEDSSSDIKEEDGIIDLKEQPDGTYAA